MKKLFILLLLIPSVALTATKRQAGEVYDQLKMANGLFGAPPVRVLNEPGLNAYSNSFETAITKELLAISTVDELALVLGHELSHWSGTDSETRADKGGFFLAHKAGYNACNGISILLKINSGGDSVHPPSKVRWTLLKRYCKG